VQDLIAAAIGVLLVAVLVSPIVFGLWKGRRAAMLAGIPPQAWRLTLALSILVVVITVVAFVAIGR
jgi:hypothetical protein